MEAETGLGPACRALQARAYAISATPPEDQSPGEAETSSRITRNCRSSNDWLVRSDRFERSTPSSGGKCSIR
jgi:hypothetical protein